MLITASFGVSQAEVLHWPKLCEKQILTIENKTAIAQNFWLQSWNKNLIDELDYTVVANSRTEIPLTNEMKNNDQDYSLIQLELDPTLNVAYTVSTHCLDENSHDIQLALADIFEGGVIYYRINPLEKNELHLKNLFPGRNTFHIEEINLFRQAVGPELLIDIEARKSFKFDFKISSPKTYWIKITAEQRFNTSVFSGNKFLRPSYIEKQTSQISLNEKYFLVAPRTGPGDQFVIKIKDPVLIQKARDQINLKLEKIVFAKVILGHQGFNRNFAVKNKSFWSWSVSEVTNISDLGSTACNGFPQMVEDRAEFWVGNPGRICFWTYRIQKELSADEVMNPK